VPQPERQVEPNLTTLATAAVVLTVLYGLVDLIDMVRRAVPLGPSLFSYLGLLLVPTIGSRIGRARPQYAEGVALAVDITFTATLAARLLLPDTTASGTALVLSLKMLATALLLRWHPMMQYASAGMTLVLYWMCLAISGHVSASGNALHQVVGPLMAALLSAIGAANTDRHRRAVTESENRWRSLLDAMPDGVLVLDGDRIVFANPRLAGMLGYASGAQVLERDLRGLADAGAVAALQAHLRQPATPNAHPPSLDTRLRCFDGTTLDVAVTAAPLRYRDRPAVQVMVRDSTERKRAEQALREARQFSEQIITSANEGIAVYDRELRYVTWNPFMEELTGIAAAEVLGKRAVEVFPHFCEQGVDRLLERALAGEVIASTDVPYSVPTTGRRGWTAGTYGPLRNAQGEIIGAIGTIRDITTRRQVEEEKAALLEVARAISGTLNLSAILDRVQRRTAALLDCDRVATFRWDPASTGFRLIGEHGTPPDLLAEAKRRIFPLPSLVVDQLGSLPSIVINDAQQGVLPAELLAQFGVQTLAAVPLRVRDRPYGAFAVFRASRDRPFDRRQIELLEGISHQVALAIEMADLYRAEQEEALVSGAAAHVARELIASLNTPALLSRLCQLTSEALGADFSLTYLWRSEERSSVVAGGHGLVAEEWDALRTLKAPAEAIAEIVKRLAQEELVQVTMRDFARELPAAVALRSGVTHALYVPLRDGNTIVGALVTGYRGRQERVSAYQERIARGIGQIASLVLQNARLIGELDRANRLKSDFVATMSHELRTPLNIILGYTDLLLEGAFGGVSGEQADTLKRVDHSAQQLLGLINTTLDVSRIDAGHVHVDVREVNVADLLAETAVEMRELWERAGLGFECVVSPTIPPLSTDPGKLKVVLKNLLGNAVKFTEHGRISVSAQQNDGGIEIRVADTGTGIPSEALPIIFERFRQADSSATRRHGGVGLGLYIARRLLEVLEGRISVESTVGRGSTFRLWLPLHPRTSAPTLPVYEAAPAAP